MFQIVKFRTMRPEGERLASEWTTEDDPRITPFGRLLRRTHLDELPQLVNVLRGDLAVVGPRPEQPHYVHELAGKIPFYDLRHRVRPGLTGWAQVKYGYAGTETRRPAEAPVRVLLPPPPEPDPRRPHRRTHHPPRHRTWGTMTSSSSRTLDPTVFYSRATLRFGSRLVARRLLRHPYRRTPDAVTAEYDPQRAAFLARFRSEDWSVDEYVMRDAGDELASKYFFASVLDGEIVQRDGVEIRKRLLNRPEQVVQAPTTRSVIEMVPVPGATSCISRPEYRVCPSRGSN